MNKLINELDAALYDIPLYKKEYLKIRLYLLERQFEKCFDLVTFIFNKEENKEDSKKIPTFAEFIIFKDSFDHYVSLLNY